MATAHLQLSEQRQRQNPETDSDCLKKVGPFTFRSLLSPNKNDRGYIVMNALPRMTAPLLLSSLLCASTLANQASAQDCAAPLLPEIKAVPILHLNPADPNQTVVGRLKFRGAIHLQHEAPKFGAYSGLHITQDGQTLTAVGDGDWVQATLDYNAAGNLAGFEVNCVGVLKDEIGKEFEWWEDRDAESLSFNGEEFLVGFESNLRVLAYKDIGGAARNIPLPQEFEDGVPTGAGYSSIESSGPNNYIIITENARNEDDQIKSYVHQPSGSGTFWLQLEGEEFHLPVGLTTMPDGNLLLAELAVHTDEEGVRAYRRLRISIIDRVSVVPGAVIKPMTIAEIDPPLIYEKYESIDTRLGPNGETLIYIMADDGKMRAENTMVRMFELLNP